MNDILINIIGFILLIVATTIRTVGVWNVYYSPEFRAKFFQSQRNLILLFFVKIILVLFGVIFLLIGEMHPIIIAFMLIFFWYGALAIVTYIMRDEDFI